MDKRRSRMLSEFLARYNRGEIGKEQFLNQKKAILQEERAEEQAEVNKLNASIASLSIQIEDVEAELSRTSGNGGAGNT